MLNRWSSFADPLLSARFFESKRYSQNLKNAKVSNSDVLQFLKEIAGLSDEGDIADNLAVLSEEAKSSITTTMLVEWLSSQPKFFEQSPIEITDQLIQSGWIDLDFNKDRLREPNAFFYQRNLAKKTVLTPSLSELTTDHYAIYPSNFKLSWVKITNENRLNDFMIDIGKHRIVNLINQDKGLAQLQAILPTDQKNTLVNYLVQTEDELNIFFEELNPLRKRQGFDWLQEAQLDLNLRDIDVSEKKVLSDYLFDKNRSLLQRIETSSALATYSDPYFSNKFLTFTDYQALTDEDTEKTISQKIKRMYAYTESQFPIYPDRMGMNDEALTIYLKEKLEGGEYQIYKNEYIQTLNNIGRWLDQNGIKSNANDLGSTILQRFQRRLFDKNYALYFLNNHENTPYIYIIAKKALEDIAVFLEDENISFNQRKHQMQTMLADDTFAVCTAGCGAKIAAISEALRIQFYKPNTETLVKRFIHAQIQEIIRQSSPNSEPPLNTLVSLLWSQNAAVAGGMDVHAENYIRKQLAIYLGMEFIMPVEDIWVENADKALVKKSKAHQIKIQSLTDTLIKKLKASLTLENFIESIWNSQTDLDYDELYNELELLADVINPDKTKYKASDNYLRHYLYHLDLNELKTNYLASLGDEQAILNLYFPQENSDTIKHKYPKGCNALIDYIVDYYAGNDQVTYDKVENDAKPFYQKHLVDTAKLFFSRAYVQKLDKEGWVTFDLDKPRLQDPSSYFKQRNPNAKPISGFNAQTDQYRIFYSNLGLSWAHIQDKDQFILDAFAEGSDVLTNLFPQDQRKGAVNALIQTPQELNRLFDKLPKSQYLQVLIWLSDSELDLSANKNPSDHFLLIDSLYQVETLKKSPGVVRYLSEKYQIFLMKLALSEYPDLNKKLKQSLQTAIDKLAVISFDNDTILKEKLENWRMSIHALADQCDTKTKVDALQKFEAQFKKISDLLTQFLEKYKTSREALQKKLRNNSGKQVLGNEINDFIKFMTDSRKNLELEIKNFYSVDIKLSQNLVNYFPYEVPLQSVVEQGLNLLDISDRYSPLLDEINFLIKEKLLTEFSDMVFIPAFTELSPSRSHGSLFYEKIDFSDCDLGNAFFMADIFKTTFYNANLKKVIFAQFSDRPVTTLVGKFKQASFSTDSFFNVLMTFKKDKKTFPIGNIHYELREADLREVNFQDESIHNFFRDFARGRYHIVLSKANMQGVDFSSYDFSYITILDANLAEAKFKDVSFGGNNDLSNVRLKDAVFENVKLANIKQFLDLYDQGIRDFSSFEISNGKAFPLNFKTRTLVDALLPHAIFLNFYAAGRTNFEGVNLEKVDVNYLNKHRELIYDQNTKFPVGFKPEFKQEFKPDLTLTTYQQLFAYYDQGIRDFSDYSFSPELKLRVYWSPLPADLLDKSLKNMIFSDELFLDLYSAGRRKFQGADLKKVSPSLIEDLKNESELLFDENTKLPPTLESEMSRQAAYLTLNDRLKKNKLSYELIAVNQGLYFPSYTKGGLKSPPGECIAITRGFLQSLFLGQEEIFLDNLKVVTEFSERIRLGGPELSKRERDAYEKFNKLLNHFKKDVEGQSSLPKQAIKHAEKKSLQDVMLYLDRVTPSGDYAANIIVGNHVVSLFRRGESYGYFDSNVAWMSGTGNFKHLGKILEEAIHSAGYKVGAEGVGIEVWDVAAANMHLASHVDHQFTLSTKIETERSLLAEQDKQSKLILNNGQSIYRTLLYDMRARIHANEQDGVGQLIHSGMTADSLQDAIINGHVRLSAKQYLETFNGKSAADIQAIGRATSGMSFVGTKSQVAIAQKIKTLSISEKGKFLKNRDWNQIIKAASTTSLEKSFLNVVSFHETAATQAGLPNSLVNAAGRISFLRGLHSTIHSGMIGNEEGFLLGAGEIGYSFLSDAIERGVIRMTPKVIKQLKTSIVLSRGAAGLLGDAFDIVDLVQSGIALAKAEKNSKEYRDAIAGITFSSASIVSGVTFTALRAPGPGTVVGFAIIMGQSFYMAFSTLEEFKKYGLPFDQEVRLFFHTLVFLSPPDDVMHRVERVIKIKNTIEKSLEFLEFSPQAVAYVLGLGKTTKVSDSYLQNPTWSNQLWVNLNAGTKLISLGKGYTLCGPQCSEIKTSSLDESTQQGNYRYSCELSFESNLKTQVETKSYYQEGHFFCDGGLILLNSTRLSDPGFTGKGNIVYDLRLINAGHINGISANADNLLPNDKLSDIDNEFQIYGGNPTIYGSANKTNWFSLLDPSFTGKIIGGVDGARNILDLSQLNVYSVVYDIRYKEENWVSIIEKPNANQTGWIYQRRGKSAQDIFLGSRESAETVHCREQQPFVDTKGYYGDDEQDTIYDCQTVVVYGGTTIWSDGSSDVWYIKPNRGGHAEIHAKGGQLIFTGSTLLTHASIKYILNNNKLSISIPSQSFSITVSNYLDLETKQPNFSITDRYQSRILPLFIPEQTGDSDHITINSFQLISLGTADNKAEKRWKDSQSNRMQAESVVKQKSLNVFYSREKVRGIVNLINSKKNQQKKLQNVIDRLTRCVGNNPCSTWEDVTPQRDKFSELGREIFLNERQLKISRRTLDQDYGKLDIAKTKRETARLVEVKAKVNYETTQKITVLKKEIETSLYERVQNKKTMKKELLLSKVNGLFFLMREGLLQGDQALFSLIYPLIILIAADKIEAAYLHYISKVKIDFDELTNDYAEISTSAEGTSVFGMLKLDQDQIALMGGKGSDVLSLSQDVIYAQGGDGMDLYQMNVHSNTESFRVTTINNKAFDGEIDLLHLPEIQYAKKLEGCSLLIAISHLEHLIIKDYFAGTEYQHLALINNQNKIYIVDPAYSPATSHKDCREVHGATPIPLVPFYGAAKHDTHFQIAENQWHHYASLVMNIKDDTLAVFFKNQDLILTGLQSNRNNSAMDPAVVTVTLNNFYREEGRNNTLYTYPANVPISLDEVAKLAIRAEDAEEILINASVEIHEMRWEDELVVIPSTWNANKTHILALEQVEPNTIRVNRTDTDLMLNRVNQTLIIKDWDAENATRINSLWFDERGRGLTISAYHLNQTAELQQALDNLHQVGMMDDKINEFDLSVINTLLYFLAVNNRANAVNAAAALGFDSSSAMEGFIHTYGASLSEGEFMSQVCTNTFLQEAVNVLPWIVVRGLISESDELIQKNVFSYLLNTTFDRDNFLRNQISKDSPEGIENLFSLLKLVWGDSHLNKEQKRQNIEAYLQYDWGTTTELTKSFSCNNHYLGQLVAKSTFQSRLKLESAEIPYEESHVSRFSGWGGALPVTLGTATVFILTTTLTYIGLRHLRGRGQAPAASTLATVMIPLMPLPQAEAIIPVTRNVANTQELVACNNAAFINMQCVKNQLSLGTLGYCGNENTVLAWFINAKDSTFSYMVFAPNEYKLDAAQTVSYRANSLYFLDSDPCQLAIPLDSISCVSSETLFTQFPITSHLLRQMQLKQWQRKNTLKPFRQRAQEIGIVYLGEQGLVNMQMGDYFRALGLTPNWHEHDPSHFFRRILRSMQSTSFWYTLSAVCLETALLHPSVQARLPAPTYRSKLVVRFVADLLQFGPSVSASVPALVEFLIYQHPWSYQLAMGLRGALSMLEVINDPSSWYLVVSLFILPQLPYLLENLGVPVTHYIKHALESLEKLMISYSLLLSVQADPQRLKHKACALQAADQRVHQGKERVTLAKNAITGFFKRSNVNNTPQSEEARTRDFQR